MNRLAVVVALSATLSVAACSQHHSPHPVLVGPATVSATPTTPVPVPSPTRTVPVPKTTATPVKPTKPATNTPPLPSTIATNTAPPPAPWLPDPKWAPGAINPAVTQDNLATTICAKGWATKVRPPYTYAHEVKRLMESVHGGTATWDGIPYAVHGYHPADPKWSHVELDHVIPIELGGAIADPANMWLEPHTAKAADGHNAGSYQKDHYENWLNGQVCSGRVDLATAQYQIASDWYAGWKAAHYPSSRLGTTDDPLLGGPS